MIGDGEYVLNDIKEIDTTESFLGLDQNIRKCQNEEPRDNCTTRKYIDAVLRKCSCLPLSIGISTQVESFCTSFIAIVVIS